METNEPMISNIMRIADKWCINLMVECNNNKNHRTLILTLDYSGSMNGPPFNAGKFAIAAVLRKSVHDFTDVILIMYNHKVTEYIVNKNNVEDIATKVENWRATGATDFGNVFKAISNIVRNRQELYNNAVDIRVSFFTDGKHYAGNSATYKTTQSECDNLNQISLLNMYSELQNLKITLNDLNIVKAGGNTTVVARGFGSGNDLSLLGQTTKMGITPGNYRYANNPMELSDILTSDDVLVGEKNIINLHILDGNNNTQNVQMDLLEINQENKENIFTHEGYVFVSLENLDNVKITLSKLNNNTENIIPSVEFIPLPEMYINIAMQYCSGEMLEVAQEIVNMNATSLIVKSSVDRLYNLDKYLNTVQLVIQKIKNRNLRGSLSSTFKDMKNNIHNMNSEVAVISRNGYDNDRMSKLLSNSHAASQITKNGFRNRLNKRVDKNVNTLITEDTSIDVITELFNEIKFSSLLGDNALTCFVTLDSWFELAKNGDALCMSGYMERSELAVVDPNHIRFINIYPMSNNMSFGTYQDELLVQVEKHVDNPERVHGGFGFNFQTKDGVLSAFGNRKINFVFPLYICSENWDIARHLIKRILGQIATTDYAGFTFQQMLTIPFNLMQNVFKVFCNNGVTESTIQKFFNIARVAHQLTLDYNMKTVTTDFENWNKSPLFRTGDVISNIHLFLIKLLFMNNRPYLNNAFWLSVVEEFSRRALLRKVRDNNGGSTAYNVINLASAHNYKKYVPVEKNNTSDTSSFRLIMEEYMKENNLYNVLVANEINVNEINANEINANEINANEINANETPVFNSKNYEINETMMKPVKDNEAKIQKSLEFMLVIKTIYEYIETNNIDMIELYNKLDANYGTITDDHINAFSGLNMTNVMMEYYSVSEIFGVSDKYMYEMFLQNNLHPQHSKRHESVNDNTYINAFTQESHILVQQLIDNAVRTEINIQSSLSNNSINAEYGTKFKYTIDILEAAGIIYSKCTNTGDTVFMYLHSQLNDGIHTPLFLEKLNLLIEGEFMGLRLYRDSGEYHSIGDNPYKWPTSVKHIRGIMRSYQTIMESRNEEYAMTEENWARIFRWEENDHGIITMRSGNELPESKTSRKRKRRAT